MSERKPLEMKWSSWVDEQVARAEQDGAFKNLPGLGKPLKDLDRPYDENWWLREFIEREKVSVTPEPIELRRRIETLREEATLLSDEREARQRFIAMNALIARLNTLPKPDAVRPVGPVDVEEEIRDWRRKRGPA